jgi:hypothetical protein
LYDLFQARSRALRDGLGTSSFFHASTSSQAASQASTSGKASQSQSSSNSEPEYDIDPITNKRVYRNQADTFKGYRAQFQPTESAQSDPRERFCKSLKLDHTSHTLPMSLMERYPTRCKTG